MTTLDAVRRQDATAALPAPKGPRSAHLLDALAGPARPLRPLPAGDDPPWGDDTALALYLCYEQHYRGWQGVDDRWEWEPSLLRERRRLEDELVDGLVGLVGPPPAPCGPDDAADALVAMAGGSGPSLSGFLAEHGTLGHFREFAIHRSAYQLKEADPHTWAIPRLVGRAKAALVDIQFGEYGDGRADRVHAELFGTTMRELGLDDTYGAYLDRLPGVTLTTCNLVSLLGLHRRWRGALVGHLALFEMCSVGPMGRCGDALRKLGLGAVATDFYEVHVEADARHQVVALDGMVRGLLADQPGLAGDVVFGARALSAVEAMFARHLRDAWDDGRSSLADAGEQGRSWPALRRVATGARPGGRSPG
jgi:hypothetical protein